MGLRDASAPETKPYPVEVAGGPSFEDENEDEEDWKGAGGVSPVTSCTGTVREPAGGDPSPPGYDATGARATGWVNPTRGRFGSGQQTK
jgi:hypothetical protein